MRAKADAREAWRHQTIQLADAGAIKGYIEELSLLLESSSLMERMVFLKSIVESIEVDPSQVAVIYTKPVAPDKSSAIACIATQYLPFGGRVTAQAGAKAGVHRRKA